MIAHLQAKLEEMSLSSRTALKGTTSIRGQQTAVHEGPCF